jgi:hypothetical protein
VRFPFEFFQQTTNVIVVEATPYTHVTSAYHESWHTFNFAARVASSANQIVDHLFEAAFPAPPQFLVNRFDYIVIKRYCSSHETNSSIAASRCQHQSIMMLAVQAHSVLAKVHERLILNRTGRSA